MEGLPGIGKTTLLKLISFLWAKDILLKNIRFLFLVHLRDTAVGNIKSDSKVDEFLCQFYDTDETVQSCRTQLQDNGRSVVFLFDGYNEYPVHLQQNSYISDIIDGKKFCSSTIVISSRPYASTNLRNNVLFRVDILGFSEHGRMKFIEQTFKKTQENIDDTEKTQKIKDYLKQYPTINRLCFIPFYMRMLLFVCCKQDRLPSSSIDLYTTFINSTINEHLSRLNQEPQQCDQYLNGLTEPCNTIIKQLSTFSFQKLAKDQQQVFSHDAIKKFCPQVDEFRNCLGLVQEIEYLGEVNNKICAYNFTHLSIQEYLAACYVSNLPKHKQSAVFLDHFWVGNLHNVFNFYIAMTKGQQSTFKLFLRNINSPSSINTEFLIRLYQCFHEANDTAMLSLIEDIFDKVLRLTGTESPIMEEVITMLTCFRSDKKHWEQLWFENCHILDGDIEQLQLKLMPSEITITQFRLVNSHLTSLSDNYLSDIICTCKVESLHIEHNGQKKAVGETEQFITNILPPSTVIQELSIQDNNYSSIRWAECLFNLLKDNKSLKWLSLQQSNITDKVVSDYIIPALKENNTLEELNISKNPITELSSIVQNVMQCNGKLKKLRLPQCSDDVRREIKDIVDEIGKPKKRDVKLDVKFQ